MTVHTRQDLERIGRLARREFAHALMSDTKWRKLFSALAQAGFASGQMRVKFIDVFDVRIMHIPSEAALQCPWPYLDSVEFGPVELRSIEWLELPSVAVWPRADNLPAKRIEQDLSAIHSLINGLGRYPLEGVEGGLRVTGYSH